MSPGKLYLECGCQNITIKSRSQDLQQTKLTKQNSKMYPMPYEIAVQTTAIHCETEDYVRKTSWDFGCLCRLQQGEDVCRRREQGLGLDLCRGRWSWIKSGWGGGGTIPGHLQAGPEAGGGKDHLLLKVYLFSCNKEWRCFKCPIPRHGESEFNVQERIGGDPNLTKRGEKFAKALGNYINALGKWRHTSINAEMTRCLDHPITFFPIFASKFFARLQFLSNRTIFFRIAFDPHLDEHFASHDSDGGSHRRSSKSHAPLGRDQVRLPRRLHLQGDRDSAPQRVERQG